MFSTVIKNRIQIPLIVVVRQRPFYYRCQSCYSNSLVDVATCHGAGSNSGAGALLNYSQVFNAHFRLSAAVVASGSMPPDKVLSISEKSAIVCRIDNGAMDN